MGTCEWRLLLSNGCWMVGALLCDLSDHIELNVLVCIDN